jgi:hypothetical protein
MYNNENIYFGSGSQKFVAVVVVNGASQCSLRLLFPFFAKFAVKRHPFRSQQAALIDSVFIY